MPELNTHSTNLVSASSQYWSITDALQTGLDITGDMSILTWINLAQLPSTAGAIFFLISKDITGGNERSYQFFLEASDKMRINYKDTALNVTRKSIAFADSVDVGKWIHLAVTIDVSVPDIRIYKNGKDLGGSMALTAATSIHNSTAPVQIGARQSLLFFDGKIDEVKIYDRILTPAEIASMSNRYAQLSSYETALKSYWRFNNDGLDQTPNNNDLTNNNSATFVTDRPFGGDQIPAALLMGI